jgi:hypothetical protein
MHEAATHGVSVVRPQRGYRWMDDGVTLDILAPSMPVLADTGDDINENSIVAMLHYGGFRELFMGDAGESSEARLLSSGVDLHADVLKSAITARNMRRPHRSSPPFSHGPRSSPSAATIHLAIPDHPRSQHWKVPAQQSTAPITAAAYRLPPIRVPSLSSRALSRDSHHVLDCANAAQHRPERSRGTIPNQGD